MENEYIDELLKHGFPVEMVDGTKGIRRFFGINADDLQNKYHVEPTDSAETAFKKIVEVVLQDKSLYELFSKDPTVWDIKSVQHGFWTVPVKEEKILSYDEIGEYYPEESFKKMRFPVKETNIKTTYQSKFTVEFVKRHL